MLILHFIFTWIDLLAFGMLVVAFLPLQNHHFLVNFLLSSYALILKELEPVLLRQKSFELAPSSGLLHHNRCCVLVLIEQKCYSKRIFWLMIDWCTKTLDMVGTVHTCAPLCVRIYNILWVIDDWVEGVVGLLRKVIVCLLHIEVTITGWYNLPMENSIRDWTKHLAPRFTYK